MSTHFHTFILWKTAIFLDKIASNNKKTVMSDIETTPAIEKKNVSHSISVILPTYNERENIGPLIDAIFLNTPEGTEIVVVDDDSPDGTWQVVKEMQKTRPNLRLLRRINKKGLVSSLRDGITAAGGEILVWLDCDFSMPPQKIKDLLKTMEEGYDLVVGSRFVRGGGVEIITGSSDTVLAFIMSLTLNRFIQAILGNSFKDYTSGFIAVKRKVLETIPLRGDYGEYFIDLVHRALKKGFTIKEIPYLCRARTEGISKTGIHFLDYLKKGWKYIWLTLCLKFSKTT